MVQGAVDITKGMIVCLPVFLILSRQRADFHSQAQHLEFSTLISKVYDIGHDRKLKKTQKIHAVFDKAVTILGSTLQG